MKRRRFIQTAIALAGLSGSLSSCKQGRKFSGTINGAFANIGHQLRDKSFSAPTSFIEKDIVIIGAGVSGLSAAYHLNKAGMRNFLLLDLEGKTGGNSGYGTNAG